MKIRFVLNPYSFVFLLSGEQNYFVILETLHTEEATYIWNILKQTVNRQIDGILSFSISRTDK
jgi:hypothetical protein